MPPDLLPDLQLRLTDQLSSYDWAGVETTCREMIDAIRAAGTPADEKLVWTTMRRLRAQRRFEEMAAIAFAAWNSGQKSPRCRSQHAQALIDQGNYPAAHFLLERLLSDPATPMEVRSEARGLVGRIHKQSYMDVEGEFGAGRAVDLDAALDAYGDIYRSDRDRYLWQGVNWVALLCRKGEVDTATDEASHILSELDRREHAADASGLAAWDLACRMEAHIALGRWDDAMRAAMAYVRHAEVDTFQLQSTYRQMIEVWRLKVEEEPGARILPLLRASLLKGSGGSIGLKPAEFEFDRNTLREAFPDDAPGAVPGATPLAGTGGLALERRFGDDASLPLRWYLDGLERCSAVARIERAGRAVGTGWLVNARDFYPARGEGERLLLTNAHVVATAEVRALPAGVRPLDASEAEANFQRSGKIVKVTKAIWSSPISELDATLLELAEVPADARPIPLSSVPMEMTAPAPRMYVIGYPGGRDLELSLHDNQLLACNERRIHYRTPTEGGSSGSPVFEPDSWKAVGLHHAGKNEMEMLDGSGRTYQANEGIPILAIQKVTRGG